MTSLIGCPTRASLRVQRHRRARRSPTGPHPGRMGASGGSVGYTCNKALRLDHYQNNRFSAWSFVPMRRRADGTYEEIDWDAAIVEIAEGFKQIRDTHGGDKIFLLRRRRASAVLPAALF